MLEVSGDQQLKLTWETRRNAPCEMAGGAAVAHGSLAYFNCWGSGDVFKYDSEKREWSELPECPQRDFGLAVINNLITAVGGRSGGQNINCLSSFSGGKWETVFPPMSTARCWPAVITAQNYLIATGGLGVQGALSSVEVMDMNTQKWFTAASLPEPVYDMSATVCGGCLYLLGCVDKDGNRTHAVFTCTLDSLIRSCHSLSQSPHTSEASVWQRVADVPVVESTCTTLSGRVLAIGGRVLAIGGRVPTAAVYMYNPDSDSWLLLGNMPTARSWCLVVGLRDRIVAVGGYERSGVISATFEVGYLPLSVADGENPMLAEEFAEVDRLLEKYRPQGMIRYKSLKCLFTGPPRVGKTTLKKRLLKIITNLISSGVFSKSGGLEKPITVNTGEARECATVLIDPNHIDWQVQPNPVDEAQTVMLFIDQQTTPNQENTSEELHSHVSFKAGTLPGSLHSHMSFKVGTLPESLDVTSTPSEIYPTQRPPPSNETKTAPLDDAKKLMEKFLAKKLMEKFLASKGLRSIKDIEKTMTIYFMDSGGQPEFHEIMPIILQGPALHMVFFNLAFNLDEHIPIRFCQEDGTDAPITYESSYTGMQMIYQLLSSLYCLSKESSMHSRAILIGTHLDELKAEKGEKAVTEINKSINQLLNNAEFLAKGFVTYPKRKSSGGEEEMVFVPVDNYSGGEEEIDELQEFMKQVFKDCFDSLELPSAWHIFHLVLRDHYGETGVCSLAECEALARGCGLDEDDVPQVLRYIHRHLGTVLYYEEVQGLKKLVICNPNVVFQGIFHLVAASFAGEKAYHTLATKIRKTGEIPVDILDRVNAQHTQPPLENKHIFELLEHFKILTQLPSGSYFMPCLLLPDKSLKLSHEVLKTLCVCPLLVRFDGNYIPIGLFSTLVVELSQKPWELDTKDRYRNRISFFTDGSFSVRLIVYPAYLEFRIPIQGKEEPKKIHQFCMGVRKRVVDALKSVLKLHEHTKKTKFHLGFYCPGEADGQPHFSDCKPEGEYNNPKAFVCSKSPRCYEQRQLDQECSIWFENWKDPKTTGGVHDREMLDPGNTTSRVARDSVPDHDADDSSPLTLPSPPPPSSTAATGSGTAHPRTGLDLESVDGTTVLGVGDMRDVRSAVVGIAGRWQDLGISLGLHLSDLEAILSDNPHSSSDCLRESLKLWLRKNYEVERFGEPTWRRLAEAVEDHGGGNNLAVAQEIAREHPTQEAPPTHPH